MIGIKTFKLVVFLFLLSACSTIPQESVDLSSKLGVGLRKQHQSQIDLVNLYFSIKRKSLDEAMSRALDRYFEALAPNGSITLNRSQLDDVAADVMSLNEKNNVVKGELEKARVLLLKKLNENYLILNQANSSITGLLQSAVTVKEARSEAYKKLSQAAGGEIDFEKAFSKLEDFVLKGSEWSEEFIKELESILKVKRGMTNE